MGAGLLQLVLSSQQDQYITQNPQISFFKYSYKRHTPFSNESIMLSFESGNVLNKKGSTIHKCKVGRYGDLLSNLYFCFKLPAIYSTNEFKFRWVENIGNVIIKKADIIINSVVIDSLTGEWMTIWNELSLKDDNSTYNKIIGNTPELTNPSLPQPRISVTNNRFNYIYYPVADITKNDSPSIPEKLIYTPLNFWFTRNPSLALPLLKLQSAEITIEIELVDTESLYQVYSSILEMYVSPVFYSSIHNDNSLALANFCKSRDGENVPMSLNIEANYIFLDTTERNAILMLSEINYVAEKIHIDSALCNQEHVNIILSNNIQTKEIIWVIKRDDYYKFNYHNNYTADYIYNENSKILNKATIMWNSFNRIEEKSGDFYGYVQPYQHHSKIPRAGIYCYSFALFPEKIQPSGSYNASAVKTSLDININRNYNNDYLNNKLRLKDRPLLSNVINYQITIYSISTNIFHIENGLGSMKYS
jgi:hypothetical protein